LQKRLDGVYFTRHAWYVVHPTGGPVTQVPVACEDWRASRFNLLHGAPHECRHLPGLRLKARRGGLGGAH